MLIISQTAADASASLFNNVKLLKMVCQKALPSLLK